MIPQEQMLAAWVNRPLALLPSFARAPHVNTKTTKPGIERTVAIIPISGALTSDETDQDWGVQSYGDIRRAFVAAVQATDVKAIALLIDSPGGTASGCFDTVDLIHGARGIKPVHAILNENAFSGGYALASAADRVWIPRTGGAGSVGVIKIHADISGLLSKAGIKLTPLTYGAHKADGYPFQPLSDDVRARQEADMKIIGDLFVDTVARNRGMAASAVRATEAACFLGKNAVAAGFADAVASPNAAFAQLLATL